MVDFSILSKLISNTFSSFLALVWRRLQHQPVSEYWHQTSFMLYSLGFLTLDIPCHTIRQLFLFFAWITRETFVLDTLCTVLIGLHKEQSDSGGDGSVIGISATKEHLHFSHHLFVEQQQINAFEFYFIFFRIRDAVIKYITEYSVRVEAIINIVQSWSQRSKIYFKECKYQWDR